MLREPRSLAAPSVSSGATREGDADSGGDNDNDDTDGGGDNNR